MDNALKQRILGIIVLFSLIGICISVLLHSNKNMVEDQNGNKSEPRVIKVQALPTKTPVTEKTTETTPSTTNTTASDTSTVASTSNTSVFATPHAPAQTQTKPTNFKPITTSGAIITPVNSTSATPASTTTTNTTKNIITPDKKTKANKSIKSTIPTESAVNTAETTATETTPSTVTSTPVNTTTAPLTSASTHNSTYVVQVGQFSKKSNADALVKALNGHGFTAATQTIKTSRGEMTRVVIGSDAGFSHSEAVKTKQSLNKLLKLNSIITPANKSSATIKTATITTTPTKTTKTTKNTTKTKTAKTTAIATRNTHTKATASTVQNSHKATHVNTTQTTTKNTETQANPATDEVVIP